MARLVIVVDVDVDPSLEDPHELASYVMDPDADDPMPVFVGAEWATDALVRVAEGRICDVIDIPGATA